MSKKLINLKINMKKTVIVICALLITFSITAQKTNVKNLEERILELEHKAFSLIPGTIYKYGR